MESCSTILSNFFSDKPKLLWGDNDAGYMEMCKNYFQNLGFDVFLSAIKDDIVKFITQIKPDIVLLDLNWSNTSRLDFSGFDLEKEIRRMSPDISIAAFSAFIGQKEYEEHLERATFDSIFPKAIEEDTLNIKKEFMALALLKRLKSGEMGKPYELPLDVFRYLPLNIKREISNLVYKSKENLIKKEFDNSYWLVLCNGRIVMKGKKSVTSEEKRIMENERRAIEVSENKPSFYYVKPPAVESFCQWREINGKKEDYYPAIKLKINSNDNIFTLVEDFDTGCEITHLNNKFFENEEIYDVSESFFWGKYKFYEKSVNISLNTLTHGTITKEVNLYIVLDWHRSGFVRYNRNRNALVGRDIMKYFCEIDFTLNWGKKLTIMDKQSVSVVPNSVSQSKGKDLVL